MDTFTNPQVTPWTPPWTPPLAHPPWTRRGGLINPPTGRWAGLVVHRPLLEQHLEAGREPSHRPQGGTGRGEADGGERRPHPTTTVLPHGIEARQLPQSLGVTSPPRPPYRGCRSSTHRFAVFLPDPTPPDPGNVVSLYVPRDPPAFAPWARESQMRAVLAPCRCPLKNGVPTRPTRSEREVTHGVGVSTLPSIPSAGCPPAPGVGSFFQAGRRLDDPGKRLGTYL